LLKRRYSFYFGLRSTRTNKTKSFDISVATQNCICDISEFAGLRRYSFYFGFWFNTSKTKLDRFIYRLQHKTVFAIFRILRYIVIRFSWILVQHVKNKTGSFDISVATQNDIFDISIFCGMFGICDLHTTPLKRRFSEALRGRSRQDDRGHYGRTAAAADASRSSI
jgi:hypothetical protein